MSGNDGILRTPSQQKVQDELDHLQKLADEGLLTGLVYVVEKGTAPDNSIHWASGGKLTLYPAIGALEDAKRYLLNLNDK